MAATERPAADRCDAYHDGHDCSTPGACARALLAMCERITARSTTPPRQERHRDDR